MKFIKHLLTGLLGLGIIFSLNFSYTQGLGTGNINIVNPNPEEDKPSFSGEDISNNTGLIAGAGQTFTDKLNGIIHIPSPSEYETTLGYVMRLIQVAINRLLGILSFIALIYLLYCGFLVFSSGADDKNAQKGKKGITTAAIALAGIGLSWLIISAMIRLITNVTNAK